MPRHIEHPIEMNVPATAENFDEAGYLAANPDVLKAVRSGAWENGRSHFEVFGKNENRFLRRGGIDEARLFKVERIANLIRQELPHRRIGLKYDFLTEELRDSGGVESTENISENGYGAEVQSLIREFSEGIILDCGSGRRPIYYPNVVNYEIADYDTTDVVGIGETLPFKDNSFDAVFSIAVLEHVRNPFKCAAEIARVLKPNGKLYCTAPFLQPFHGYPHHYYNMTYMGLQNLFSGKLTIDNIKTGTSGLPIMSLTWIIKSWASGLNEEIRQRFLDLQIKTLCKNSDQLLNEKWVTGLSNEKNFELACGITILAHK